MSFKLYDSENQNTVVAGKNNADITGVAPEACTRFRQLVSGAYGQTYEGSTYHYIFPNVSYAPKS